MGKVKGPHHRGTHDRRARHLVANANVQPDIICPRCGLTRAQGIQRWGRQGEWEAGHVVDGVVGGALRVEHRHCNRSAGATAGNTRREPHSELW